MTTDTSIATAADYADAMMTARRAKNVLVLLILLLLLIQLAFFFLIRYQVISITHPATATTPATAPTAGTRNWADLYEYVVTLGTMLGVILPVVLSFVLLLVVNIMLVGRLIGVARLTSAYIWCLLLVVLLFPWQAFWGQPDLMPTAATWKLPGVLYTWYELSHDKLGATFASEPLPDAILRWARYVGFPVLAIIILLAIQVKSNRGMRQALGEDVSIAIDPTGTAPNV
jgi:hypothetical protein